MREIKFRAWNSDLKKMTLYNGIFNNKPFTETSTFPQYESCPRYHKINIMEFTGIKDKNGKDIYDGDIVKPSYDATADLFKVEWGGPWEECGFGMTAKRKEKRFKDDTEYSWDTLNINYGLHLEVIGNIYENQSLIDS